MILTYIKYFNKTITLFFFTLSDFPLYMVGNTDVIISDGINRNNHRFVLPDQITQCQAILYRVGSRNYCTIYTRHENVLTLSGRKSDLWSRNLCK
jgi:hypothetical protein